VPLAWDSIPRLYCRVPASKVHDSTKNTSSALAARPYRHVPVHTCAPHGATKATALATSPSMRITANLVGWSVWVVWGRGGRDARSPATKHALLVNSAMSAIHRYASLCEVEREEGESAHRKAAAAAPSYSALLAATVDGPHGSSCDDSSTPRARQSGWTVTGGTGMIGRRGTPEGSVLRY
jgi:hypothetical protein